MLSSTTEDFDGVSFKVFEEYSYERYEHNMGYRVNRV